MKDAQLHDQAELADERACSTAPASPAAAHCSRPADADRMFQILVEHSPDAIARFDERLRCVYANAAFVAETGWALDQIVGALAADIPSVANTADYRKDLHRALTQGRASHLQVERQMGDGRTRYCEVRLVPELDAAGRTLGVTSVSHDITTVKATQAKLEKAEQLAQIGFWEYDYRTDTSRLSDQACALVGQQAGWSPNLRGLLLSHLPHERKYVAEVFRTAIAARRPTVNYVYTQLIDGELRHLNCQAEIAYSPTGEPLTLFAVAQDVTERERASQLLRKHEQEFRVLIEHTPDTVARFDQDCRRTYVNPTLANLVGRTPQDLTGRRVTDLNNTPSAREYEAKIREALDTGEPRVVQYHWEPQSGRPMISHIRIVPELDAEGRVASVLAVGRDITTLKETETRLAEAQRVARICQWEWDYKLQQSYVSAVGREILGLAEDEELTMAKFRSLIPKEQDAAIDMLYRDAFARHLDEIRYEHRLETGDGNSYDLHTWVRIEYAEGGQPRRAMGVTQDVTPLKRLQRETHQLAFYDPLTKLPNRALLQDRLHQSLSEAARNNYSVGVVLLDIDHFQKVNDSLDYKAGDTLLKVVADRLAQALRDCDTVARMGGDEFAVIVSQIRSPADLAVVARRLKTVFEAPIALPDTEIVVTASAGIAVYPADGADADELLAHADAAMYHAKHLGRDNFQFYARELTATALERLKIETDLRKGIERNELELFYQPKVDIPSGAVIGAEALMRWRHPERGLVPPDRFIGIAEDTGLIIDMGRWALHAACVAAKQWNAERERPLKIAVNLSPRQFYSGDLPGTVAEALKASGCDPAWIELEITESLLLNDRADIRAMLGQLHALGVTIAIDDFGTGYSALSYLTRFPVDTIKIDRSFVRELPGDGDSAALVQAIVTLSRSLRKEIVAEGVETDTQRDHLNAWGCTMAQGFLYSKPVPREEFTALLCTWALKGAQQLADAAPT